MAPPRRAGHASSRMTHPFRNVHGAPGEGQIKPDSETAAHPNGGRGGVIPSEARNRDHPDSEARRSGRLRFLDCGAARLRSE